MICCCCPRRSWTVIHPCLVDVDRAAVYDIANGAAYGQAHIEEADALVYARALPIIAPLAPVTWMEIDMGALPNTDYLGDAMRDDVLVRQRGER